MALVAKSDVRRSVFLYDDLYDKRYIVYADKVVDVEVTEPKVEYYKEHKSNWTYTCKRIRCEVRITLQGGHRLTVNFVSKSAPKSLYKKAKERADRLLQLRDEVMQR